MRRHRKSPAIDVAVRRAREHFPFPGYLDREDDTVYHVIAGTALTYAQAGARVLDFGAGACDRTAILQLLGFRCTAWDDYLDPWHLEGDNRERIRIFATRLGIDWHVLQNGVLPRADEAFDMIVFTDIIEHLHDSPRDLLLQLLARLRPEGHLLVTVPNAVNLRKRLDVLRGRTNMSPFTGYYHSTPTWRGHVREYVADDLRQLADLLRLEVVELRGVHQLLWKIPRAGRGAFRALTVVIPGVRDSWLLLARKPAEWVSPEPSS